MQHYNVMGIPASIMQGIVARVERAAELTVNAANDVNVNATNVELEAAITRKIDIVEFGRIVKYCRSVGLVLVQHEPQLDITFLNMNVPKGHPPLVGVRISVLGKTHIIDYAHSNRLDSIPLSAVRVIRKARMRGMHALDVPAYDIRVNLRLEEACAVCSYDAKIVRTSPKMYRLKNRVSFISDDGVFRYDLTRVRTSHGTASSVATSGLSVTPDNYEVEIEITDFRRVEAGKLAESLVAHIGRLLNVMADTPCAVTTSDAAAALKAYSALSGVSQHTFLGPQPVTLSPQHVMLPELLPPNAKTVLQDYTVTDKADGERHMLFVTPTGYVYLLPRGSHNVKYLGITHPTLAGTLLDGELVSGISTFAIFDIYFYRQKDVRRLPLWSERIDLMKTCASVLSDSPFKIHVKKFLRADKQNMFAACNEILDSFDVGDLPYEIDGLIFTPTGALPTGKNQVFKWKPPEQNTIDFLVRFESRNDTRTIMGVYCGHRAVKNAVISVAQYIKHGNAVKNVQHKYVAHVFYPMPTMTVQHASGEPRCLNGDIIDNKSIIECAFRNDAWVPLRVRYDKVQDMQRSNTCKANDLYTTAIPVWKSIQNPVTVSHIRGKEEIKAIESDVYYNRTDDLKQAAANMRAFHNFWIKTCAVLGRAVARADGVSPLRLMDIGVGKGGDIGKWVQLGISEVFGVDTVSDNITNADDGAYVRLMSTKRKLGVDDDELKYIFIALDASLPFVAHADARLACVTDEDRSACDVLWSTTHQNPWTGFALRPFSIVSLQFDLHYFFETPSKLDNLCANVAAMLQPGGCAVGTCLDGERVAQALADSENGVVSGKTRDGTITWQLEKKYGDEDHNPYGKTIGVYVASINQVIDEWLVDKTELERIMNKHGLYAPEDGDVFGDKYGSFSDVYDQVLEDAESLARFAVPPGTRFPGGKAALAKKRTILTTMEPYEKQYSFLHFWFAFVKK